MGTSGPERSPEIFTFGPFALDGYARTLTSHLRTVRLEPMTFELLEFFVRSPGRLLTENEIISELACGEENVESVERHVVALREVPARYSPRAPRRAHPHPAA